jgi:hypothetical protein
MRGRTGTPERGTDARGTVLFHVDCFDQLFLQIFELGNKIFNTKLVEDLKESNFCKGRPRF